MVFFVIGIVCIVFVWIINLWNTRKFVRLAYKVPSNRWHTFLGFGKIARRKDLLSSIYEYANKYGSNCVFWMGPYSFFLSSEPQSIKEILTSKNCIDKPPLIYNGFTSSVGFGLISQSEPDWSSHRKLFNRAFSPKNLISFVPIFHREINALIVKIERSLEKGETVDMLRLFRVLTLHNASISTLKRNMELTQFNSTEMSKYCNGILEFIAEKSLNHTMNISLIRKLAEMSIFKTAVEGLQMFKRLVDESVGILIRNDTTDPSVEPDINSALDYAISGVQQNILKVHEIESQMLHLLGGSFETTSTTLFFVLSLLAMHPEYQERVYEEILGIIPNDDGEITVEMVDQLSYLDMVLNETMRVLPVIPMVFRTVSNENLSLSNGLTLPVGQRICIDIYRLHRRKDIWGPNADSFNPDNFLPSNVETRHAFSYIPFTKGQRFCIGWRYATILVKISLAKLIKTYKFTTDFKYEDLIPENHVSLKLKQEPQLYMEHRTKS